MPTKPTITDSLKAFIEESGMSRYEISRLAQVQQSQLSRFVNDKRSLTLEAVDRLAECLGLELVRSDRQARGQRSGPGKAD